MTPEQEAQLFDLAVRGLHETMCETPPYVWRSYYESCIKLGIDSDLISLEEWLRLGLPARTYAAWCLAGKERRATVRAEPNIYVGTGNWIIVYTDEPDHYTVIATMLPQMARDVVNEILEGA